MWSNTNTNICYSNNIRILFEYRIIRSPLIWDPIWDPYDIPFASFMLIIKRMAKTIVHIQELFLFLYFLTQQIKIKLSFTEVPWTKESLATKFCNAILNLVIFSCFRAFFMLLHFEVLPRSNKPVPHNYSLLCCDYKTWLTPPFVADFL